MKNLKYLLILPVAVLLLSGCSARKVEVPEQKEEHIQVEHERELRDLSIENERINYRLRKRASFILDSEFKGINNSSLNNYSRSSDARFDSIVRDYKNRRL